MKSILYAGAALMIGASIYGFVDYKKNSHKKERQQCQLLDVLKIMKFLNLNWEIKLTEYL